MPQIGWFEILIIVVMTIIIVGPKDFPIILKKVGSWTGYLKSYFIEVQRDVSDMENSIEEDFNIEEDSLNKKKEIKKKDE